MDLSYFFFITKSDQGGETGIFKDKELAYSRVRKNFLSPKGGLDVLKIEDVGSFKHRESYVNIY